MTNTNTCHDVSVGDLVRRRALSGRRSRAVVGAVVLAVIAGGCGGGSAKASNAAKSQGPTTTTTTTSVDAHEASADAPPTESGTAGSACKLLSDGDVTAAMRRPMKVSGDGGAICSYSATTDPSVVLYVQTFASRAAMSTNTQIEASSEHIDGLGDDAFWSSALDLAFVRKGDRGFSVASPSLGTLVNNPQASKSAIVGLAKITLRTF